MKYKVMAGLKKTSIFWALLLLVIIMSILSPSFLTGRNLANVVKQISINGILAVGMTVVIITGGIDLSVGSIVSLSSIVAAMFAVANSGYPFVEVR